MPPFFRLVRRFVPSPVSVPLLKIKCTFDFRCGLRSVRPAAGQSGQISAMKPSGDRLGSIEIHKLAGDPMGKARAGLTSTVSEAGNDANSCANTTHYQLNLIEKTIGRTALTKGKIRRAEEPLSSCPPRLHRSNQKLRRVELQICSRPSTVRFISDKKREGREVRASSRRTNETVTAANRWARYGAN